PSLAMASGAAARRLTFASLARGEHIWSLSLDTNRPSAATKVEPLTEETGFQTFPSISKDGTKLACLSHAARNDEVWLFDLATGKKLLISNTVSAKQKPIIHSDGTRITWVEAGVGTYMALTSSGVPERFCSCPWTWDWSSDYKHSLHFYNREPASVATSLTEVETGKRTVLLNRPGANVYNTSWSPDRKWLVFQVERDGHSQLYVAPYADDQPLEESAWIAITDGSRTDELPAWSPDGNWIYAVSNQDGFDCIWAFPVDARTKTPSGPAVGVFHSHGSRVSLRNANGVSRTLSVAKNRIVFNQGEITGNIWMTEIPR
ncbi:MAG TPA: hypothetical protein VGD41_20720, partial [Pyrinomonadaceae bacterium]